MNKVGLITISTGEYTKYLPKLIKSFQKYFFNGEADLYIFTNKNLNYEDENIIVQKINHFGWPVMPLLRAEVIYNYRELFKNDYLFLIDGDVYFNRHIGEEILSPLTATLHRNIERKRIDFNYEKRKESTAYISPNEGEKYYIGGFIGGFNQELVTLLETISKNTRTDIKNGIRAIWGDESHVNRYLIDNEPYKVLGPEYMCPVGNTKFLGRIMHHDKDFKKVNIKEARDNMHVNPEDFKNVKIK